MLQLQKTKKAQKIDLDGPDGNAFVLLGVAKNCARRLGVDYTLFQAEATSGGYVNLLRTFEKYFGAHYVLKTKNKQLLKEVKSGNTTN